MIAIRTARTAKLLAAVLLFYVGAVAVAAAIFIGDRSYWESFGLWLWALPAFLLAWYAVERSAKWFFALPWIRKLSSPARIAVGVVAMIAVLGVVISLQWFILRHAL